MAKNTTSAVTDRITLPFGSLKPVIEECMSANVPLGIEGGAGLGKTAMVKSVATEHNRKLCNIVASVIDPSCDIAMAYIDKDKAGFLDFHFNKSIPWVGTENIWLGPNGEPPVLFIDELPNAPSAVMSQFQKMLHEMELYNRPLIPGTWWCWAGNRSHDKANVNNIPFPLLNRSTKIEVTPDLDAFTAYCYSHDINEFVPAFLKQRPELLHYDLMTVENSEGKFKGVDLTQPQPTPRSWAEMVSPILEYVRDPILRLTLLAGAIGNGPGREVETYFQIRDDMPSIDEILKTGYAKKPKNVATTYVVVSALVRRADKKTLGNILKYLKLVDAEFSTLFVNDAIRKDQSLAMTKEYTQWAIENGNKLA